MKISRLPHSFKLIFPMEDNSGKSLDRINVKVTKMFIDKWQGMTETKAKGFWIERDLIYCDHSFIFSSSSKKPFSIVDVREILLFCFTNTDQLAFFYSIDGVDHIAERTEGE